MSGTAEVSSPFDDANSPHSLAFSSAALAASVAAASLDCIKRYEETAPAAAEDTVQAAHAALLGLHSSLCRLAHWLAAGGGQHLPQLQNCHRAVLVHVADTYQALALLAALGEAGPCGAAAAGTVYRAPGGRGRDVQATALATLAAG
ncbi:hypothetical protein ABPG75_002764 [Micractinium tetrahymenae]